MSMSVIFGLSNTVCSLRAATGQSLGCRFEHSNHASVCCLVCRKKVRAQHLDKDLAPLLPDSLDRKEEEALQDRM